MAKSPSKGTFCEIVHFSRKKLMIFELARYCTFEFSGKGNMVMFRLQRLHRLKPKLEMFIFPYFPALYGSSTN